MNIQKKFGINSLIFSRFCLQGANVGLRESRRTIISNQTLVLQSITRKGSGSYRCIASNARGKSISNAYKIDVKCKYFRLKSITTFNCLFSNHQYKMNII